MKTVLIIVTMICAFNGNTQSFNINKIANDFLKEGQVFYDCPNKNFSCAYKLEIIHTGRNDYDGNEILHLKLVFQSNPMDKKKREYLLLPDFEMHPLQYVLYNLETVDKYEVNFWDNSKRKGDYYGPSLGNVFITPIKNGHIRTGFSRGGESGANNHFTTKAFGDDRWTCEEYYTVDKENSKKEIGRYLESLEKYQNEQLKIVKEKGYDKMITDFFSSADTFNLIRKARSNEASYFDQFKIVSEGSGTDKNYKMHFPFTDKNYYDKENFYSALQKDQKGRYTIKDENLVVKSGTLIPFEDFIMIVGIEASSGKTMYYINGFISTKALNPLVDILIRGGDYNIAYFSNPDFFRKTGLKPEYEMWVQLKSLSPTYNGSLDPFLLTNFIEKLVSTFN